MIARMSRVEIICLRRDLEEMVEFIQGDGHLHLEEVPLVVEGIPGFLHRIHLTDAQKQEFELLTDLQMTLNELTPLLPYAPVRWHVLQLVDKLERAPLEQLNREVRTWNRQLRHLRRQRLSLTENVELLIHFRRALEWVAPLVQGRDVELGKSARAILLQNAPRDAVEHLERRCAEMFGLECDVLLRKVSRTVTAGIIAYPAVFNDQVEQLLQEEGIVRLDMPHKKYPSGKLEDVVARLNTEIAESLNLLEENRRDTAAFAEQNGSTLHAVRVVVQNRMARFEAMKLFAQSRLLAVIHGWMPSERIPDFESAMERRFGGCAVLSDLSLQGISPAEIPTLLKNHRLFKPFEVLLSLFKPPAYGTIDPTPVVAITFLLFYGYILGDVLYGLAVIVSAWALRSRFAHLPAVKNAGTVGIYMGISGAIFGVLFGEYGGNLGEEWFGIQPVWFHRSHHAHLLLAWGILFGLVHVPLSLMLGIFEDFRQRHRRHALEKTGLLMGLGAIGTGTLGFLTELPTDILGGIAAILFLGAAGVLFKAAGAMAAVHLLEIVSLIGNVLSYARLMALGIASAVLAEIANLLGAEAPSLWVGIPLALVVHLLNVGIGIFSPVLHSLRLNYVESLPKFYKPEGKYYMPFRKEAAL